MELRHEPIPADHPVQPLKPGEKAIDKNLLVGLKEYMSQFGQALEAHGIRYGPAQIEADQKARKAIEIAESLDVPATITAMPTVGIYVEGGLVQGVRSNIKPIDLIIYDADNEEQMSTEDKEQAAVDLLNYEQLPHAIH